MKANTSNLFVTCLGVVPMLVCGMLGLVAPAMAQTGMPPLVIDSYTIPSGDQGIELFVRNKRPADMTRSGADRIVLYVHGSTQASEATFDLALDGMSWMDDLARHGWDVWFMELRGYGRSTKPPEMDQPPADNPPIAPASAAVRDVATVMEHIRGRRGVSRISLIGWSRGTALIGLYATQHGDHVRRLVLYAPTWVRSPSAAAGAPAPIGAYQTWTVAQARQRLQAGAPAEARDSLMPPGWFESWSAAVLATDPVGAARTPPAVRTPAGTVQDGREYWQAGKPIYDPARITAPTLIVVGGWDGVTAPTLARALFAQLVNTPIRRLVEIGEATHFMMLEKNRHQLFREVRLFLEEQQPTQ
jgi:pimeloyl-ACP methyl ester carboxylesterase